MKKVLMSAVAVLLLSSIASSALVPSLPNGGFNDGWGGWRLYGPDLGLGWPAGGISGNFANYVQTNTAANSTSDRGLDRWFGMAAIPTGSAGQTVTLEFYLARYVPGDYTVWVNFSEWIDSNADGMPDAYAGYGSGLANLFADVPLSNLTRYTAQYTIAGSASNLLNVGFHIRTADGQAFADGNIGIDEVSFIVPEPATLALLGMGFVGTLLKRSKK